MRRYAAFFLAGLLVALCCAVAPGTARADLRQPQGPLQDRGPSFVWSSFQRFWNTRCLPGCEIADPVFVTDRYIIQYGDTASLVVRMNRDVVSSVSAIYSDPQNQRGGGPRWIKLVDSIITIGTYRWPDQRVEKVRDRFAAISPLPAQYRWQNSWFRRSSDPTTGWEFRLDFVTGSGQDID